MKKKIIIIIATVLVCVFAGLLLFYNTGLYDSYIKKRIEKQMGKIYGLSFEVIALDENRAGVPDFKANLGFKLESEEKTCAIGECDWKGKVLRESYIHYYYAYEMDSELESIISGCFDDCYVIRDCNQFAGNKAVYDMVNVNSIKSAQDYIEKVNREQTYFRVYLGENVSTEKLQTALDTLQDKAYKGNVYFMPISDELLKELKASKIACLYPLSSLSEILSGYIKSIDKQEIEKLIYETRGYIRAEYVPKYGSFEIIE